MNMILCDRTVAAPRPVEVQSCDWVNQLSPGSVWQKYLNSTMLLFWPITRHRRAEGEQLISRDCSCPVFSPPLTLVSLHLMTVPVVWARQGCPERYERVNTVTAWCHSPAKWNRGSTQVYPQTSKAKPVGHNSVASECRMPSQWKQKQKLDVSWFINTDRTLYEL